MNQICSKAIVLCNRGRERRIFYYMYNVCCTHLYCGTDLLLQKNFSYYIGEVFDGLRHGQGVYFCAESESKYDGQWCNGMRHGKGKLFYDSTESFYYDGQWVKNMKEGHGVEIYR